MSFKDRKQWKINVNSLLFLILITVYCLTASNEVGNKNSLFKYIILIVSILQAMCVLLKKKRDGYQPILTQKFKGFIFFVASIIIYTIIKSIEASYFSFRTIKELLFLVCPIIYGYLIINVLDKDAIYNNMCMSFVITFVLYIMSLNLGIRDIILSIINSSFSNSFSALESHIFCGLALAYFVYFCYHDQKKIYKYLSLLFVFMTFKRLSIVMSLFLLVFSNFKMKNKFVNTKIYIIGVIALIIMSIAYYQLMQPQNVQIIEERYNISMSKLTSTRTDRLRSLLNTSYQSYGFGSSTEYMYKYLWGALEMDIVRIIIELGYLPVIILISSYLYFARANYYTFFYMIFQIMNLIFSSSLTSSFSWIMTFMIIGVIWKETQNEGENDEKSKYYNTSI